MATGTAPTTTAPGSDIVDQLEKYISEHDVESMVKTMMRDCFQSKPKDPAAFCLEHLARKAEAETVQGVAASTSTEDGLTIAVSSADPEDIEYLKAKNVLPLVLKVLKMVMKQKLDDPAQAIKQASLVALQS